MRGNFIATTQIFLLRRTLHTLFIVEKKQRQKENRESNVKRKKHDAGKKLLR
jgi:hypothetical protein